MRGADALTAALIVPTPPDPPRCHVVLRPRLAAASALSVARPRLIGLPRGSAFVCAP